MSDLDRLRRALAPVEDAARDLPWSKERPWAVATHVWEEHGTPRVDLHDLSIKKALMAIDALSEIGPTLDAGAVTVITGRGKHMGGVSRLKEAVSGAVREHSFQVRPQGPGRFVWVFSEDAVISTPTSPLLWGVAALILLGVGATLYNAFSG